jgi:hypothetical protein
MPLATPAAVLCCPHTQLSPRVGRLDHSGHGGRGARAQRGADGDALLGCGSGLAVCLGGGCGGCRGLGGCGGGRGLCAGRGWGLGGGLAPVGAWEGGREEEEGGGRGQRGEGREGGSSSEMEMPQPCITAYDSQGAKRACWPESWWLGQARRRKAWRRRGGSWQRT